MRICKKIFPEKLICFAAVLMFCLIPAASHPAAASYTSQTGTSGNLLTNPDWENGVSGWEIAAVSRKDIFEEGELFVSAVYQDIPIEESMAGKILKLSGNICVSPADPQQKVKASRHAFPAVQIPLVPIKTAVAPQPVLRFLLDSDLFIAFHHVVGPA